MIEPIEKDLKDAKWIDHPASPMIEPPRGTWLIGDPSVLTPDRTPDGRWHMFANSVTAIHHYISDDGVQWEKLGGRCFPGMRAYVFEKDGGYYILYERFMRPWHSGVALRRSANLRDWGPPQMLLEASDEGDGRVLRYLGNPCLVKTESGYRLYFSSGWVFLRDCLYIEPRYIGVATATALLGPYVRQPGELFGPDPTHPHRNMGAGSIKVVPDGKRGWWGFHNGIYRDPEGRSRSAIMLLHSEDGLTFEQVSEQPIVSPGRGWKRAFAYACGPVVHEGEVRLYYNGRSGWFRGRERIGFAAATWGVE